MGRVEVAGHHDVTATAKIKVRIFFATTAGALGFGRSVRWESFPRDPIERANGGGSETDGGQRDLISG